MNHAKEYIYIYSRTMKLATGRGHAKMKKILQKKLWIWETSLRLIEAEGVKERGRVD